MAKFPTTGHRRLTLVWIGLMSATGASWAICHRYSLAPEIVAGIVIAIAFLKVRFVGLDFMELRTAPTAMRLAFEAWLLIACVGLIRLAVAGA